jgi:hypothetical protein
MPERIDEVISAEIPDADGPHGQLLYDVVSKHMIHWPCGKDYPGSRVLQEPFSKPFSDTTVLTNDSYPTGAERLDRGPLLNTQVPTGQFP